MASLKPLKLWEWVWDGVWDGVWSEVHEVHELELRCMCCKNCGVCVGEFVWVGGFWFWAISARGGRT